MNMQNPFPMRYIIRNISNVLGATGIRDGLCLISHNVFKKVDFMSFFNFHF